MRTTTDRRSRARRGFTLIEMVFALSIAALVMASAMAVANSSMGAFGTASSRAEMQEAARAALDRVAAELRLTNPNGLFPTLTPLGSRTVQFPTQIDPLTGNFTGPVVQIGFEYDPGEADDGLDNDGDGLVDEGRLVLTRNPGAAGQRRVTLCGDVAEWLEGEVTAVNNLDDNGNGIEDERGFWMVRAGDLVTVMLTVETVGAQGRRMRTTLDTAVLMKN